MLRLRFSPANIVISCFAGLTLLKDTLNKLFSLTIPFCEETGRKCTSGLAILKAVIALQVNGFKHFSDLEKISNDPLYHEIVGASFSPVTFRQRSEKISQYKEFSAKIDSINRELLGHASPQPIYICGHKKYTIDIDGTDLENKDSNKEKATRIYNGKIGYFPLMVYLDDLLLTSELRPGTTHDHYGVLKIVKHCIKYIIKSLNINVKDIILRADSAHDDALFFDLLNTLLLWFIIKANPRDVDYTDLVIDALNNGMCIQYHSSNGTLIKEEYFLFRDDEKPKNMETDNINRGIRVTKNFFDKDHQRYSSDAYDPSKYTTKEHSPIQLDMVWYNFKMDDSLTDRNDEVHQCFELYKDHGGSEQFHSEVKTDMNQELLPSGKFSVNYMWFKILSLSYNLLRITGKDYINSDEKQNKIYNTYEYQEKLDAVINQQNLESQSNPISNSDVTQQTYSETDQPQQVENQTNGNVKPDEAPQPDEKSAEQQQEMAQTSVNTTPEAPQPDEKKAEQQQEMAQTSSNATPEASQPDEKSAEQHQEMTQTSVNTTPEAPQPDEKSAEQHQEMAQTSSNATPEAPQPDEKKAEQHQEMTQTSSNATPEASQPDEKSAEQHQEMTQTSSNATPEALQSDEKTVEQHQEMAQTSSNATPDGASPPDTKSAGQQQKMAQTSSNATPDLKQTDEEKPQSKQDKKRPCTRAKRDATPKAEPKATQHQANKTATSSKQKVICKTLGPKKSTKKPKRRRLITIIHEIMRCPCQIVKHARYVDIRLPSQLNNYKFFQDTHNKFSSQ